jgi:hypothetical protein
VIVLRKKREPKSVHSIIRIDYIPGCSNDFEPDNPSLEERENLVSDTENVAEDGISLREITGFSFFTKGKEPIKR